MELTSVLKIWREIVIVNLYVSVYHCENEKTDDLIAEGRMPSVGLKYVVSFTSQVKQDIFAGDGGGGGEGDGGGVAGWGFGAGLENS